MATTQFGKGTIAIANTVSPVDQFECQISNFTITSSANTVAIPATYCVGPSQAAQGSTFAVDLTHMSDWGDTPSLSQLLWDEDGNVVYFEFTPEDTTIPKASGSMYAVAPDFGGEGDGLWTSTTTMPCVAKPTLTPQV